MKPGPARADHTREHTALTDACIRYLNLSLGSFAHRLGQGVARFPDRLDPEKIRFARFGEPGAPDILWFYRGHATLIEIKTGRAVLSENQREYHRKAEAAGMTPLVIRSVEELVAAARTITSGWDTVLEGELKTRTAAELPASNAAARPRPRAKVERWDRERARLEFQARRR